MPLQMTSGGPGPVPGAHRDPHLVPEDGDPAQAGCHQTNAPTPVMSRPTMRVWMVSVPS